MIDDPQARQDNGSESDAMDDIEIELHPPGPELQTAEREEYVEEPPTPGPREAGATADHAQAPDDDTLTIEVEDLPEVDAPPPQAPPEAGEYLRVDYMGHPGALRQAKGKGNPLANALMGPMVWQMLVAGAIGGVLAWAALEPGRRADELWGAGMPPGLVDLLVGGGMLGATIGGLIGAALGSVEGIVIGARSRVVAGGALGLLIGGAGGAVGGVAGQAAYIGILMGGAGGDPMLASMAHRIAARALGWALIGLFVGLGPGVMMMAPRKIVNGLVGGAIGGLIGGLLFDPISVVLHSMGAGAATPARFLGITVTGLCTGLAIGLVEEIRKESWLIIVAGPLAGKQFIIYKPTTWIGSASGMDIPMRDKSIAPKHCALAMTGSALLLHDLSGGRTFVNGRAVTDHTLMDDDLVQIGQTGIQYHARTPSRGPLSG